MGCSDSYETNNQTMKSQSPNTYFNKPIPTEYDLHFEIPNMPTFSPLFLMSVTNNEIKEYPYGGYTGQMKDGQRNGKGIFVWNNGDAKGHTYQGEWKDDKMHGKGLYIYTSGKKYYGDWFEGDMHGKGIMRYLDGYYEGDWVHDKREGKGKFLWRADDEMGDIYEGEWKDDEKNGKGILKKCNGEIYEGEWKDDEVVGNLKYIGKGEPNKDFEEKKKNMFQILSEEIITTIIVIVIETMNL